MERVKERDKGSSEVGAISTGVLHLHDLTGLAMLFSKCTNVFRLDYKGRRRREEQREKTRSVYG